MRAIHAVALADRRTAAAALAAAPIGNDGGVYDGAAAAVGTGRVDGAGEEQPPAAKRKRCASSHEAADRAPPDAPPSPSPKPLLQPQVAGGYLCTGHDAFLTHEPSPGDAMALLHARVARVFFAAADPAHGALLGGGAGGAPRLHELPSLNHHYLVYRVEGAI
jgi:hypothetical protein